MEEGGETSTSVQIHRQVKRVHQRRAGPLTPFTPDSLDVPTGICWIWEWHNSEENG